MTIPETTVKIIIDKTVKNIITLIITVLFIACELEIDKVGSGASTPSKTADTTAKTEEKKHYNLSGTVTQIDMMGGSNNEGIKGITISITGTLKDSTTTNSKGVYEFKNIPSGAKITFSVKVNNQPYCTPDSQTIVVTKGRNAPNFKLYPKGLFGDVEGVIIDRKSTQVINAASVIIGGSGKSTLTDRNGKYSVKNIKSGHFKISVSKEGYKIYEGDGVIKADEIITKNIQLTPQAKQDAPPNPPTNLNRTGSTSDTINISWSSNTDSNGTVTAYLIAYKAQG